MDLLNSIASETAALDSDPRLFVMPKRQQLAELAQTEAELHLATVKCQKAPRNSEFRREQANLQEKVQVLRAQLFGQGNC